MPTAEQLAHIQPVDGDGANVVRNDDGTVSTSWPDGTVRLDETDGRVMVTFADDSVLNIDKDGTRTLNDVNGSPLDPQTGEAAGGQGGQGGPEVPTPEPTTVKELQEFVEGLSSIADLAKAAGILRALDIAAVVDHRYAALTELAGALQEALEEDLSPVSWFLQPLKMLLEVLNAIETPERGASMRSWSYTLVYDAMGLGDPPEPPFSGNVLGAAQDALNRQWWDEARNRAKAQLSDGASGVALRNRVLLLIAKCAGDPAQAVTELWAAACRKSGDDGNTGLLAAYPVLGWPQPTGD